MKTCDIVTPQVSPQYAQIVKNRLVSGCIDTLRLAYPLCPRMSAIIEVMKTKTVHKNPFGQIEWSYGKVDGKFLPSSFSGLSISDDGKWVYFEFSLHKFLDDRNYNDLNYNFLDSMTALNRWLFVISSFLGYPFKKNEFRINRVDVGCVYDLECSDKFEIEEFVQAIKVHCRSEKYLETYPTSIHYGSRYLGFKLYHKKSEYIHYRKQQKLKAQKQGKNFNDVELLVSDKKWRFEIGVKKMKLNDLGVHRLEDLPKLRSEFLKREKQVLSIRGITDFVDTLPPKQRVIVNDIKKHGKKKALKMWCEFASSSDFYKQTRALKKVGIYVDFIQQDILKEKEVVKEFELKKVA